MVEPPPRDRPLPLFAWFEVRRVERQRIRARRLRLRRRAALLGAGIACLGLTIALMTVSEVILAREMFANAYNWYHLP